MFFEWDGALFIRITVLCAEYVFSRIGTVFESDLHVEFGGIFLITEPAVQQPGVVFAYRAHIAKADAVLALQLWRPVNRTVFDQGFQLVDVVYYSPNTTGQVDVSHTTLNNI